MLHGVGWELVCKLCNIPEEQRPLCIMSQSKTFTPLLPLFYLHILKLLHSLVLSANSMQYNLLSLILKVPVAVLGV
jgi:hypothetical protein